MNLDLSSVLKFFSLYFLFCLLQYVISLLETVFNLITAYLGVKLVEYQEKLDAEEKKQQETSCIGFQIPTDTEGKEDNDDE